MKNAYVTEDHFGDDGSVTVGMILTGMTVKRFDELEGKGLVREATADEVKAGYQPPFEADTSETDGAPLEGIDLDAPANEAARRVADEAQKFINQLREDHGKALDAERERADTAETALTSERERAAVTASGLEAALKEIAEMKTAAEESGKAIAAARAEVEQLKAAAAKQDKTPANKKAADAANKGA